ncbi:hypothetical protein GCM10029992_09950 [Glycomyces albus]
MAGAREGGSDDGADPAGRNDADGEPAGLTAPSAGAIHDVDPVLYEVPVVAYGLIVLRQSANASPGAWEWQDSLTG